MLRCYSAHKGGFGAAAGLRGAWRGFCLGGPQMVSDRTVVSSGTARDDSRIRRTMAAKKRAKKKAAKKAAKTAGAARLKEKDFKSYGLKFYGEEERELIRSQAEALGLSLSAWVRLIVEGTVTDQGDSADAEAGLLQATVSLTEGDRLRIARGAAMAGISGQPTWLRYVLLAAARGEELADLEVLLDQLRCAVAVGERIRAIKRPGAD